MAVDAKDEIAGSLLENHLLDRCRGAVIDRDVAVVRNALLEILQRLAAQTFRMIVDDKEFRLVENLGMIEPQCLEAEIDAIIVVIGCHADGEALGFLARRRHGRFAPRRGGIGDPSIAFQCPQQPLDARGHVATVEDKLNEVVGGALKLLEGAIAKLHRRNPTCERADRGQPTV